LLNLEILIVIRA